MSLNGWVLKSRDEPVQPTILQYVQTVTYSSDDSYLKGLNHLLVYVDACLERENDAIFKIRSMTGRHTQDPYTCFSLLFLFQRAQPRLKKKKVTVVQSMFFITVLKIGTPQSSMRHNN